MNVFKQHEYINPDHPIFKEKWQYAFKLSNGSTTPTDHEEHQKWHDLRRKVIFEEIESKYVSLEGIRCLDIACSSGFWSIELAKCGAVVDGFDGSKDRIEKAKAIAIHQRVKNVSFSIANLFSRV